MKSPFDANVPRRKPRTRLSTMLAEVDPTENDLFESQEPGPVEVLREEPLAAVRHPGAAETAPSSEKFGSEHSPAPTWNDQIGKTPSNTGAHVDGRMGAAIPTAFDLTYAAPAPNGIEPLVKPLAQPLVEPLAQPPVEPLAEPPVEALAQPPVEPLAEPPVEPLAQPPMEPLAQPPMEPLAQPPMEALAQPPVEPLAQPPVKPVSRVKSEPIIDTGPENARGSTEVALRDSRLRISELRVRLRQAQSEEHEATVSRPGETASRIKETVASLVQRLDRTSQEKAALEEALEQMRSEVALAEERTETERAARSSAETLAAERLEVAEALAAESEALADERDEALRRISEFKDVERQQAELLLDFEAALKTKTADALRKDEALAELQSALDATVADLERIQGRLEDQIAQNRVLERRIEALEAELTKTDELNDALTEIQKAVDRATARQQPTNGPETRARPRGI
ncbi:MAG: hypothetical protein IPK13_26060 [Deltaproteobacteria bacterium]|nr:hypothetical protein [Deltaproteobacteria bacterium]